MFISNHSTQSSNFVDQLREAREEREAERLKEVAIVKIQATVRGWLARVEYQRQIRDDFDSLFEKTPPGETPKVLVPPSEVFREACQLVRIYDEIKDSKRLEIYTRYLLTSMKSNSLKDSYVSCALGTDSTVKWIKHIKEVMVLACKKLKSLKVEISSDNRLISLYLHLLLTFTGTSTWALMQQPNLQPMKPALTKLTLNILSELQDKGMHKALREVLIKGLCRSKLAVSGPIITTILTLSLRPLLTLENKNLTLSMFIVHILSVPALIHHVNIESKEGRDMIIKYQIFDKVLNYIHEEVNMKDVFNSMEGCYALCLLANIINLANLHKDILTDPIQHSNFCLVVTSLLVKCGEYVTKNQSSLTYWHPLLGWFSQSFDQYLNEAIPLVRSQLQQLWSGPMLKVMFQPLNVTLESLDLQDSLKTSQPTQEKRTDVVPPPSGRTRNFLKNTLERSFSSMMGSSKESSSKPCLISVTDERVINLSTVCSMYYLAMTTLTQMKMDILTGICHHSYILHGLWTILSSFGSLCGLKTFLHLIATYKSALQLHFLMVFCDAVAHLVSVLDDLEMYEQQKPFNLQDYEEMSLFLNQLVYKMIKSRLIDLQEPSSNPLFQSSHRLLKLLYKKDSRRSFVQESNWYITEVNGTSLMSDLSKNRMVAKVLIEAVPHILPHKDRVVMFRKQIKKDKLLMTAICVSTLITVRRSSMVEDGFRQLASLSSQALKGVIRVRFVNEQGLDEAGIDQDGVFKEFLEETLKRVFDPSLNLFRLTSEERLYPSPISSMTENHLQLFEFIGKMLAKAIYEGILVDCPFATFFLSQVIGEQHSSLYSYIDELPSLDPELYKNLTYIKHYDGDVSDLGLSFSYDEDYLGQVVTHELRSGGKGISVTNENRIAYVHLMGRFKLYTQIKDQVKAFINGFRSLINYEWLLLFSAPEFQRLISGDNVELDLVDLRQHTHYYGGFHDKHRVISWLWDILKSDFSEEERALFLKFITSCSKPPLLGFANLEPPFSIRCVEVNDDEDTGDTVGSVIRGFFAIRKDPVTRLPTSSTCFNLLKLPNYQKRSNLKEKLRYAIHSNTGFELS